VTNSELITIRQFDSPEEANDASILLESEEINTSLTNVSFEQGIWTLINDAEPACLQVRDEDAERAEALLEEFHNFDPPNRPSSISEEEKELEKERLEESNPQREEAIAEMQERIDADPDRLITIRHYWDAYEANLASNLLESNEIFTSLTNESLAHNAWHYNVATKGVGLQIRAKDFELADSLLQDVENPSEEKEIEREEASDKEESPSPDDMPSETDSLDELAHEAMRQAVYGFCISFIGIGCLLAIVPYRRSIQLINDIQRKAEEVGLSREARYRILIANFFLFLMIMEWLFYLAIILFIFLY
jgi:hypothetical protein